MKRFMAIAVLILTVLTVSGCVARPAKQVTLPEGPVAVETLTREKWPQEVADWVGQATSGRVQSLEEARTFGNWTYVLIYGGTLPSEGYTVRFLGAEVKEGILKVVAEVDGPSKPFSSRVELPLAVGRVGKHEGRMVFEVGVKRPPLEQTPPVKTGTVTIDPVKMKELQQQVDNGHQPWRLDPFQVAMDEGIHQYGFNPKTDSFRLVRLEGTEAQVEVTHKGTAVLVYRIYLTQPNGLGRTSIWTIRAIELLSKPE